MSGINSYTSRFQFAWQQIENILDVHKKEFGERLIAVVLFGPMAKNDPDADIELLEVVQDWTPSEDGKVVNSIPGHFRLMIASPQELTAAIKMLHPSILPVVDAYEVIFDKNGRVTEMLETVRQRLSDNNFEASIG